MVQRLESWQRRDEYRSPSITRIQKDFKDHIFSVPSGSTIEDIIDYLDGHWHNRETLDLENCVLLPQHAQEVLYYNLGSLKKHLSTDTERINLADENDFIQYGAHWIISQKEFNEVGSNLLEDAWNHSLQNRKKFLKTTENRKPAIRFRYDAVRQDWHPSTGKEIYNVWDYMTLLKGGAKFYTEHGKGNHLEFEMEGNACWVARVPSDSNPDKIYRTVISYREGKEKTMRNFTGSCSCPDYARRKNNNTNPICKHMAYAVSELACHIKDVETLPEIIPFPTINALKLHEKIDYMLYACAEKTDTSKDILMRAYIDQKVNYLPLLFSSSPHYPRKIHDSPQGLSFKAIHI